MSEHRWEFGIDSGGYYPSLTDNWRGNDFNFTYDNDDNTGMSFYGFSHHLDELENEDEVASRLFSLQLLLNGALRVAWGHADGHPTRFTAFGWYDGGTSSGKITRIEEYPFSAIPTPVDNDFSSLDAIKAHFISYLIHLAKEDEELRRLLFHVGLISTTTEFEKIHTWAVLYKIQELIKAMGKGQDWEIDEFVDPSKLKAFMGACNNRSLLGLYARHDQDGGIPKNSIVDLGVAITLILNMTGNFARSYVAHVHP